MIAAKITELPLPSELDGKEGVERVLHLIAALVDLKDPSTSGHSLRTARRARALVEYMKLPPESAILAYHAGLVHDCGRLGVDTHILNKAGRLNDREMDVARKHALMTIRSFACLPNSPGLAALGEIAGRDHERYDGNGYPDGLKGEEIHLVSRIMSVVDAFDSMIAAAHYRLLTPKGAVVRIEQAAGKQFDPEIAKAVVEMISSGVVDDFKQMAA
jgi:HD-GYP domain-containing protein (c-di-GMP phosphodiesterase class II)